jgi:hypothetical protein
MRRALFLLSLMVGLATVLATAGCGGSPQVRFDGVYEGSEYQVRSGPETLNMRDYLRFHEDGTVCSGLYAVSKTDPWGEQVPLPTVLTPENIFALLTKENARSSGAYELNGDQLKCSTVGREGDYKTAYEGTVGRNALELDYVLATSYVSQVGNATYQFKK